MMTCDLCEKNFDPNESNAGNTFVGGYAEDERVETVHLCHDCVAPFHALPIEDQHATVASLTSR